MSKSVETASNEEPAGAGTDSVYDFLYHDSRRIGSFLSQFDNNGLLTGITAGEAAVRGAKRGWKVGGGAELPLLGGGKLEFERQPSEAGSETMERSYDPFWTNALQFLDVLSERSMIQPQIEHASFGQFVLVKGFLSVLDLSMYKTAWNLPTVQAAVRAGQAAGEPLPNRHHRRGQNKHAAPNQMPSEADIMLDLMTVLPHTVHASVMTTQETVWATMREEYMVTPPSDLVLSHGTDLPGEWAMLGILNGRPDIGHLAHQEQFAQISTDLPAGLINSAIGAMAQALAPIIRTALGRPSNAYGVTPILVFREVA